MSALSKRTSLASARRLAMSLAIPVVVWFAAASVPELQQGALFLAPFLLLLTLWKAGVDPTPALERAARKLAKPRAVRSRDSINRRRIDVRTISGGRIIAFTLAGRGPPIAVRPAA